jgi:hypothetical protein
MSKDNDNNDGDFLPNFGDLDPKKYEEYIRKIYKDLTGNDLPTGDIEFIPLDELKEMGTSMDNIQNMTDEESQEAFNQYIEDNDMELELDLKYVDDTLMVEEKWIPQDEEASLTRIYNYDQISISGVSPSIQKEIYTQRLDMLIENEEYEEAAEVRDLLNEIKND